MQAVRIDDDLREDLLRLWRPSGPAEQRYPCPNCSPKRKPYHQKEPVLALSEKDGVLLAYCHHGCGLEGGIRLHGEGRRMYGSTRVDTQAAHLTLVSPPQPLAPPVGRGLEQGPLSSCATEYLMSRGISQETACAAGVGCRTVNLRGEDGPERREMLVFGYATEGQSYAQKLRSFPDKKFTQVGSAQTFWLGDDVIPGDDLVIVEGEMDALSLREVGFNNVVSVPNGAPVKVSEHQRARDDDRKYNYIWSGKDLLQKAKRVIIAGDNDAQGQALAEEIARRWGRVKSWKIEWPDDCKDANDVLVKHGPDKLREIVANPSPWPIAGVYDANHFAEEVRALYTGGLSKGSDPGLGLGDLYSLSCGQLTVVTGIPGSGKSSVFNQIMVNMAEQYEWPIAIYSSETPPHLHIPMLAQIHMAKPFFPGPTPRMSEGELDRGIEWVNRYFTFLHSENTPTYQELIERLEVAVLRSGIRMFLIDPSNYLKQTDENSVEWVGQMLEAFRSFAQSHGCHAVVVAHPTKLQPGVIPGGYSISGSAHWANRADFGVTIHRPEDNPNLTQFVVWKVRFAWTGRQGTEELFHDPPTGRFSDYPFNMQKPPGYGEDPWA